MALPGASARRMPCGWRLLVRQPREVAGLRRNRWPLCVGFRSWAATSPSCCRGFLPFVPNTSDPNSGGLTLCARSRTRPRCAASIGRASWETDANDRRSALHGDPGCVRTILDPAARRSRTDCRSAHQTTAVSQENVIGPRQSKKLGSADASLRPTSAFPKVAKRARNREQGRLIQVKAKPCPGM